jgi:hypothetical protein
MASLRRASVVVVLNASDHDHFTVSGEAQFRRACPEWAEPMFITDHDIADKLNALLDEQRVDSVVFASNSLITRAARGAIGREDFQRRWAEDGPNTDVGVLVLHQYLSPGTELELNFIGSASLRRVGVPPRSIARADIDFPPEWLFTDNAPLDERRRHIRALSVGYGPRNHSLWARSVPSYPAQWEPVVWDAQHEPLISMSTAGERVVIDSLAPIDLMDNHRLLGSMIASSLRPRGCLLVDAPGITGLAAFTPALASAIERRRFVHRIAPDHAREINPERTPYHFFDELIVAREWRVDEINALDERTVLRKLEQGGSLVATFTGPADSPVTVRLHGQPQYALRANQLASWFISRLDSFKGDLWATRALAEAVVATQRAYKDQRLIPHALRVDFVRRHLTEALVDRVHANNVDDNVLATAGTYAALNAMGVPGHDGLRRWAGNHLDMQPPSVVAQVLILVPDLSTPARRQRVLDAVRASASSDDSRLLMAYAAMIFAREEHDLLLRAVGDPSLGLGVRAELLRALLDSPITATDETAALAATVRERVDRLVSQEGGLEAVCLGNAALIDLARRQGIGPTTATRPRPVELDARTVETTELLRQRDEALRTAEKYQSAGRQATTLLTAVLVLVAVAAVTAVFVWAGGDLSDQVGIASAILTPLAALIAAMVAKARRSGVPPWPIS